MDLSDIVGERRVIVCAGAGGVGKTTTSAALALGLAMDGARVAVVTIDPAQRLAQALGLDELDNAPRRVDGDRLTAPDTTVEGELWAMTLDPHRTLDELVALLATDAAARDELLDNRLYRGLASAVAGSQELAAVIKLHELHTSGRFDAIVLDTPPSRNALDFLDGPQRLSRFLHGRALRMLTGQSGVGRLLGAGTDAALAILRRLTGAALLADLRELLRALGGLLEGFDERARAVDALLRSQQTTFLIITTPQRQPLHEALVLARYIEAQGMALGAHVVNRVRPPAPVVADDALRLLIGDDDLAARVLDLVADERVLADRDEAAVRELTSAAHAPVVVVPELEGALHGADGLQRVHAHLLTRG